MADDSSTPPSSSSDPSNDDVAKARAAVAAADAANLAKVQALIASSGTFDDLLAGAKDLRASLDTGSPFYAHLNAIVIGGSGLKGAAAAA